MATATRTSATSLWLGMRWGFGRTEIPAQPARAAKEDRTRAGGRSATLHLGMSYVKNRTDVAAKLANWFHMACSDLKDLLEDTELRVRRGQRNADRQREAVSFLECATTTQQLRRGCSLF